LPQIGDSQITTNVGQSITGGAVEEEEEAAARATATATADQAEATQTSSHTMDHWRCHSRCT